MIIYNIIMALGYSLKGLSESSILNECIVSKENQRSTFAKIDGRGSAFWFFLNAVTSVSCGFLFVVNNYLPMFLCLIVCIISTILSYKFLHYETKGEKVVLEETSSFKIYFKDLRTAFKHIFSSNRLKALLLFSGTFTAILTVRSTISNSLYSEIGIQEEYFGIIEAVFTSLSGIAAKHQNFFHEKYRNKLLTNFSLTFSIIWIVVGLVAIISNNFTFTVLVVLILFAIQYIIKGPYYTLIKRYLNSFSTPTMSTKIYSANTVVESLFSSLAYWFASFLLNFTSTAKAITILGCIFTVAFVFILDYMRTRIGLKPEEYSKSDISFTEVH